MARKDALAKLQQTLVSRRSELRKRIGMDLDGLANNKNGNANGDSADAAFDSQGEELASQLAELEAKEVAQIERALLRIKQGKYGTCDGCGCKIPVARLSALPYSTLCIKCQREVELDSNWLEERVSSDWASLHDGSDEREVNLSDIEMDLSK